MNYVGWRYSALHQYDFTREDREDVKENEDTDDLQFRMDDLETEIQVTDEEEKTLTAWNSVPFGD